jgi:hypothetical protein
MSDRDPRDRDPRDLRDRSERYVDDLFGSGQGRRHLSLIDRYDSETIRDALHMCHVIEADTRWISPAESYLVGMAVLLALRSHGPAAMFAKTLRHLGVPREKILETAARLSMWIGAIPAAEAVGVVQKAVDDWDRRGPASLESWFPDGVPKESDKEKEGARGA